MIEVSVILNKTCHSSYLYLLRNISIHEFYAEQICFRIVFSML